MIYPRCQRDVGNAFLRIAPLALLEAKANDPWKQITVDDLPDMVEYYARATASKVTKVSDTTKRLISKTVEDGIRAGKSIPKIVAELEKSSDGAYRVGRRGAGGAGLDGS